MFKYTVKRQLRVLPGNVTVFEAVQKDLERKVEIRVLNHFVRADSDEYLRFEREFKTIARLDHPNVVKVYDWGLANDKIYYVTEMKPGKSFEDFLAERGRPFTVQEALEIGVQIIKAVAYLHKSQIVHRDVTAGSIYYHAEKNLPYIAHFSLVKNLNLSDLTARGVGHLQPHLLTPERMYNLPEDHRVDLFLFGTFLYRLLTGEATIKAEGQVQSMEGLFDVAPVSSKVPEASAELDAFVARLLSTKPDERPATAEDCVPLLEELLQEVKVRSKRGSTTRARLAPSGAGEGEDAGEGAPAPLLAPSFAARKVQPVPENFRERVKLFVEETDPRILAVGGIVVFFGLLLLLLWLVL